MTDISFSIIVPTYNRSVIIANAIKSVIDQTYEHWELIIVDDGSSDNTREVIESFDDKRIKYFFKDHEERSIARNFGINMSKGDYISFLDDDDEILENYLAKFYEYIHSSNGNEKIFLCKEYAKSTDGKVEKEAYSKKMEKNLIQLIWEKRPSITSFVFSRAILEKIRFSSKYNINEDYDLLLRVIFDHKIGYVPHHLFVYDKHPLQSSQTKFINYRENGLLELNHTEQLIKKHLKELKKHVSVSKIYDLFNRKLYAYASRSIKSLDFEFFKILIKKIKIKGSPGITFYFVVSLVARAPYFYFKKLITK